MFAPDGTFLASWAGTGLGPSYGPVGLVIDADGDVYVSDVEEDRVVKFRLLPPLAPQ